MLSSLKQWFQPAQAVQITLLPENRYYSTEPGQTILQAALAANIPLKHKCKVGSCGTCRYKVVSGQVKAVQDVSYTLKAEEAKQGVILACQTIALSNVVLASLA